MASAPAKADGRESEPDKSGLRLITTKEGFEIKPKHNFKVGDLVQVKEYEEMGEEFGYSDGGIDCGDLMFLDCMQKYCGLIFTIKGFERNGIVVTVEPHDYLFSPGMLKHPEPEKDLPSESELLPLFNSILMRQ